MSNSFTVKEELIALLSYADPQGRSIKVPKSLSKSTRSQQKYPQSRGQYEYHEALSLPIEVGRSIQCPYHCDSISILLFVLPFVVASGRY